jgi:ABC-2 type transport system permease protein
MTAPTSSATQTVASIGSGITPNRPPFLGMVQAELRKIVWWRAIWFTLLGIGLLMLLLSALNYFVTIFSLTQSPGERGPGQPPAPVLPAEAITYDVMTALLNYVREYSGLVIAILAVMLIAAEFQFGTIRIVLARGVGRIRLLFAKLCALLIAGLIATAVILALHLTELAIIAAAMGKSDTVFGHMPSFYWSDAGLYLLTILYNLVVTLLFATFLTVLTRSLAFGLVLTLVYFLAEGVINLILSGVGAATQNKVWSDTPNYLLGNNLSNLAAVVLPKREFLDIQAALTNGQATAQAFDGTHAIVVTLIYSAIFLGVSLYLTWKRDVLQ